MTPNLLWNDDFLEALLKIQTPGCYPQDSDSLVLGRKCSLHLYKLSPPSGLRVSDVCSTLAYTACNSSPKSQLPQKALVLKEESKSQGSFYLIVPQKLTGTHPPEVSERPRQLATKPTRAEGPPEARGDPAPCHPPLRTRHCCCQPWSCEEDEQKEEVLEEKSSLQVIVKITSKTNTFSLCSNGFMEQGSHGHLAKGQKDELWPFSSRSAC